MVAPNPLGLIVCNNQILVDACFRAYQDITGRTRFEIWVPDSLSPKLTIVLESDGTIGRIGLGADVDANAIVNIGGDVKLNHVVGATGTPTVTSGTGAGANAIVGIQGNDAAGTITLTTSVLDTPTVNLPLVNVTFNTPYTSVPKVILMPANATSFGLAPNSWQLLQANVTVNGFTILGGTVALPALMAAEHIWNYVVMQ